jgi:hypothetical protein
MIETRRDEIKTRKCREIARIQEGIEEIAEKVAENQWRKVEEDEEKLL